MNKMQSKLMEKTGRSEEECLIIDDILNNHFVIGKNNKIKICNDFMTKLNIDEQEADELYNQCAEIIVKGIFRK